MFVGKRIQLNRQASPAVHEGLGTWRALSITRDSRVEITVRAHYPIIPDCQCSCESLTLQLMRKDVKLPLRRPRHQACVVQPCGARSRRINDLLKRHTRNPEKSY